MMEAIKPSEMKQLHVTAKVSIDAPINKVWEVLIAPKFIRQWSSLPSDFPDYYLETGRVIEWVGSSKITVTDMAPQRILKQSVYENKWGISPSNCDISYTYKLNDENGAIQLAVEIGDFSQLSEGKVVHQLYSQIAEKSLVKIKALAENRA